MNSIVYGVVAVPMIIGLVTVLTRAGLPSHFAPLLDVIFGIGMGFAGIASGGIPTGNPWGQVAEAIIAGIGLGLSASGLYQVPGQFSVIKSAITSRLSDAPTVKDTNTP